jgi:hypothetical protein
MPGDIERDPRRDPLTCDDRDIAIAGLAEDPM